MLNEFKSEVVGCYIMPQLGKYEAAMGVLEGLGWVGVGGCGWVGGWVGCVRACMHACYVMLQLGKYEGGPRVRLYMYMHMCVYLCIHTHP